MTAPALGRFGDRIEQGPGASFRCARCGELAGVVRVARAGTTVNMGPPFGNKTTGRDGLVLGYVLGTAWHAESAEVVGAVQALIDRGHAAPAAIRDISGTLWEVTPFYRPGCGLNYCSSDWDTCALFDDGFYDCTRGNCPKGHQHVLDD